jgi:hypothetical protein
MKSSVLYGLLNARRLEQSSEPVKIMEMRDVVKERNWTTEDAPRLVETWEQEAAALSRTRLEFGLRIPF